MENCIILGAGFSKGYCENSPVMSDFFDVARNGRVKTSDLKSLEEKIAQYFPNEANPNLESVASFFYLRRRTGSGKRNDESAYRRLVRVICAVLEDVHLNPRSERTEKIYSRFFHMICRDRTPIVSFNYDLVADKFLAEDKNWSASDGYGASLDIAGTRFTDEQKFWSGRASKLAIFKLHGSINWGIRDFRYQDGSRPIEVGFDHENKKIPISITNLKSAPETIYNTKAAWVPFIVPPVAVKAAYLDEHLLDNLWHQARDALKKAHKIFMLGYSCPYTDSHVDALIRDALYSSDVKVKNKSVYIVNKDPSLGKALQRRFSPENMIPFSHIDDDVESFMQRCISSGTLVVSPRNERDPGS